jgi:integrase
MASIRARITKRVVDAAVAHDEETQIWDTDIKGFFLRVHPSGRKTYALKYRVGRNQRKLTIGQHGSPWTAEDARIAAKTAISQVTLGADPAAEKREALDALTVADLIDRYLRDGPASKPSKRQSTWDIDASNLNRHIRPLIGRLVANSVSRAEAARCISDIAAGKTKTSIKTRQRGRARITGGPGTARRTRITVAAMFNWGVQNELVTENPFRAVKLAPQKGRERFLTAAEARRLFEAVDETLDAHQADAIRLLLLTGARKTEILGLRWDEVELAHHTIALPSERTKAGTKTGGRRILLSPAAAAILRRRSDENEERETPSPYVFPASRGDGHMIFLRKPFLQACAKAKLNNLRIHDLRHSFASFAAADGASLFLIGKLLGHASMRSTERYAHLADDPLRAAAAGVSLRLGMEA